jgi:hypothetical protein
MVNSGGYKFDEVTQVVTVESSQLASIEESIAVCERLTQDPRIPRGAGFLFDLRTMTHLLQFDQIYQIVDWHKVRDFPLKGRFAFLVDRPATIGTANIFCTLLQLYAIEADMFDNDELAHTWLSSGPRSSGEFARGSETRAVTEELADIEVVSAAR